MFEKLEATELWEILEQAITKSPTRSLKNQRAKRIVKYWGEGVKAFHDEAPRLMDSFVFERAKFSSGGDL